MNSIVLRKSISAQTRLVTVTRTRSFSSRKCFVNLFNRRKNSLDAFSGAGLSANRDSVRLMSRRNHSDFIEHCWSIDNRNRLLSNIRNDIQYASLSATKAHTHNIASMDCLQENSFPIDVSDDYYYSNYRNNSRRGSAYCANYSSTDSNSADVDASVSSIPLQSGEFKSITEEIDRIDTSRKFPKTNVLIKKHLCNNESYYRFKVKKYTDISMNPPIIRVLGVRYFSNRSDNRENERENENDNENENRNENRNRNGRKNGNESTKVLLRHFLFQIHPDYFQQVRINVFSLIRWLSTYLVLFSILFSVCFVLSFDVLLCFSSFLFDVLVREYALVQMTR
jgi:hypothetical protein